MTKHRSIERFNRTLADEFLYNYKFRSESDRRRRLQTWVHNYNLHRHHTAINGTPASRVNNLYEHYTYEVPPFSWRHAL
ncbi:integrase core domain-containing protein [Candidatus Poriferisocius sp.]|uniref:integrase core domain-containing protein n=1 Tax=Candidatus Poriferisocius sp. TaxID=3101276 RepID=UPI003B5A5BD5